ncbi:MAG: cation:H+ antiporter [Candidatus Azotimanducaceae bacterium]|jgi:cation:H+ antiporter
MDYLILLAGIIVLIFGGDFLVKGAIAISLKFNISPLVIGMTVVSFATSAPELLVSVKAALSGHTDITLGNVIGSNIANIGLVLGCTTLIFTLPVLKQSWKIDWPVMMGTYALFFVCFFFDKKLGYIDGTVFLTLLGLFLFFLIRKSRKEHIPVDLSDIKSEEGKSFGFALGYLSMGAVALYFGSEWLVTSASSIASNLGVTERIISLTMVAVGTSIPELVASLVAAYKKEGAMSLGNLIGSNIFNILAVLGTTALIQPIALGDEQLILNDFPWMLAFSTIIFPMMFIGRKSKITRLEGLILLVGYFTYIFLLF